MYEELKNDDLTLCKPAKALKRLIETIVNVRRAEKSFFNALHAVEESKNA